MIFEKVFKEIQDSIKKLEDKIQKYDEDIVLFNSNLTFLIREMNKTATKKKVE